MWRNERRDHMSLNTSPRGGAAATSLIFSASPRGGSLSEKRTIALSIYLIPVFLGAMFLGPTLAMTHGIVSLRMRALASAILFFVLNLIGLGLGPLLTGMISDLLEPSYGDQALRYALVIVVLVYIWCAFHYAMAARDIREDLARAPK